MDVIAPYYKACTAIIVPFLTQIGAALLSPSDGGSTITPYEWISAIIISLVAGGAVFTVKNKDPNATHQDESVMPPDPPVVTPPVVEPPAADPYPDV